VVGDTVGNTSYWKPPNSPTPSQELEKSGELKHTQVTATTFGKYVDEYCKQVGLVKIDVEGAETKVLTGAMQTLHEFQPHLLLELHPWSTSVEESLNLIPGTYRAYHLPEFRDSVEPDLQPIGLSRLQVEENTMLYLEPPYSSLDNYPPLSKRFCRFKPPHK